MKKYVKPTVVITGATGLNSNYACIVKIDEELLESIFGIDINEKSFAISETCEVGIPIDSYCKFASAELGAAQAFIS